MAVMLSTIDNPYNPLENFESWFQYDMVKGYNCCAVLDRLTFTSPSLSPEEDEDEIEKAIDQLIATDPLNLYIKVKSKDTNPPKDS